MTQHSYLVVGSGLTGSTFARVKANAGFKVKVIDSRNHIAGNAYDSRVFDSDDEGDPLLVHEYGPHIFHTNSKRIYDFLSGFTHWTPYEHRVLAQIKDQLVPLPFNFRSIEMLFDPIPSRLLKEALSAEFGIGTRVVLKHLKNSRYDVTRSLHDFIYEFIFKNYTEKMWGVPLEKLGPTVADRVPVDIGYDDRYFIDTYQALPTEGYTAMVSNMLDHPNIEVELSTPFDPKAVLENQKVFFTGSMDSYYKNSLGPLPYRSLSFEKVPAYADHNSNTATVNYPSHPTITRSTSMRTMLLENSANLDVFILETPEPYVPGKNDPYYPMTTNEAKELYSQYEALNTDPNLMFAGRLGRYQYLNMDAAVGQALKLSESF